MHVRELIKGMDAIIPDGVSIQDFAIVTGSDVKISQQAPYMYQFSVILREV